MGRPLTKTPIFTERQMRTIIRDEMGKENKKQISTFEKIFMTKGECLKVNLLRPHINNGDGDNGRPKDPLVSEKRKFYGALTAMILGISTLLTIIGSVLVVLYIS